MVSYSLFHSTATYIQFREKDTWRTLIELDSLPLAINKKNKKKIPSLLSKNPEKSLFCAHLKIAETLSFKVKRKRKFACQLLNYSYITGKVKEGQLRFWISVSNFSYSRKLDCAFQVISTLIGKKERDPLSGLRNYYYCRL